jgi:hypothetical protein
MDPYLNRENDMQAMPMPRPRSALPSDVLKTVCLVVPIITGALLLRQLAATTAELAHFPAGASSPGSARVLCWGRA